MTPAQAEEHHRYGIRVRTTERGDDRIGTIDMIADARCRVAWEDRARTWIACGRLTTADPAPWD